MILILSHDRYEQATEGVIDWLLYYRHPFLRLDTATLAHPDTDWEMSVHDGRLVYQGVDLQEKVGAVFARRFSLPFPTLSGAGSSRRLALQQELYGEQKDLVDFTLASLKDRFWLPEPAAVDIASNKLTTMPMAVACGLAVPRTYIVRTKADLSKHLLSSDRRWITKPIHFCRYYRHEDSIYTAFSEGLQAADLNDLPERFHPSLLQERVEAVCELRIFYLMGEFYAEASISQPQAETDGEQHVDIKLRQGKSNLHFVPYQLPQSVATSLEKLMKRIGLNTGSIDLMLGKDGQYYFLEVNPIGQFSAPSEKNNFQLERKVAELLIEKDLSHGKQVLRKNIPRTAKSAPVPSILLPA